MNERNRSICVILGVIAMTFFAAPVASAQELMPVYPANGETVRFQDLVDRGFEWIGPSDAVKFQVRIFGPDAFLSQVPFPSETSPVKLQESLRMYFPEGGEFSWQVERVDADGNVLDTSNQSLFYISNQINLIPTPTPEMWPTPSGDVDRSARIDSRDLFILASSWILSDGLLRDGDLDRDSVISKNDLLLYMDRFGESVTPPPPLPPVGEPRDVYVHPDSELTWGDIPLMEIRWSPPVYPVANGIVYDVLILLPYGQSITKEGITTTSYKPFQQMTQTGHFSIYIQARLDGVGTSNIVTSGFDIVLAKTPTPTPVPQTANVTGSDGTNSSDVAAFLQTFNTYKGHVKFNSLADLHTDEKIDRQDLLLFQEYYKNREKNISAPRWLTAEVPVIVSGMPSTYNSVELVSPYELELGQSDPKLGLAESFYTRFTFSAVSGAIDYFVSLHYQRNDRRVDFFTGGETTFTERLIPIGHDEIIAIEVQAAGEGLQLGEKSETLRVIIPAN